LAPLHSRKQPPYILCGLAIHKGVPSILCRVAKRREVPCPLYVASTVKDTVEYDVVHKALPIPPTHISAPLTPLTITSLSMNIPSRLPPWANVILFTLIVVAVYSTFAKKHFYRDPNGIFFDSNRAYQRRYSLERESEALEFLQNPVYYGANQTRDQDLEVCATIVTFGSGRPNGTRHPLEVMFQLARIW
jgi:hypothetical protein